MSSHRYGAGDHPSQQINVRELRERLHIERLAAVATRHPTVTRTEHRAPAPSRLSLTAPAYRHLVAVAVFLVLAFAGAGVAAGLDAWRAERETSGWIKACIQCHGRSADATLTPSVSAS